MRSITIPPAVDLVRKQQDGTKLEESTTFLKWLSEVVDLVKPFRVGPKGLRRAIKVLDLIDKAKKGPSNVLTIEDDDWEAIKNAVEEAEWIPENGRRTIPFMEAIEKAAIEK